MAPWLPHVRPSHIEKKISYHSWRLRNKSLMQSLRAQWSNLMGCNCPKWGECFVALLRLGRARRGLAMTSKKTFCEFIILRWKIVTVLTEQLPYDFGQALKGRKSLNVSLKAYPKKSTPKGCGFPRLNKWYVLRSSWMFQTIHRTDMIVKVHS